MFSDQLTKDDIKVYGALVEKLSGGFANACRWYGTVASHLAARLVVLPLCYFLTFLESLNRDRRSDNEVQMPNLRTTIKPIYLCPDDSGLTDSVMGHDDGGLGFVSIAMIMNPLVSGSIEPIYHVH